MFARLEMKTHELTVNLIQVLVVNLLLLHVIKVNDQSAVADEHFKYQFVFSVEGLAVRLVCKLNHT